jgi:hypothetical protein
MLARLLLAGETGAGQGAVDEVESGGEKRLEEECMGS